MRMRNAGTWMLVLGIAVMAARGTAEAQSGSLYRRSLTFVQAGSVTLRFNVAGPIAAGGQSSVALEFGPDGNAVPLTAEPLPGTVEFVVTKGAQSTASITTASAILGTGTTSGITDKTIRLDYSSMGRYLLSITHDTDVGVGVTEAWTIVMSLLPTTRAVVAIETGEFTSMVPAPAACGTGSGSGSGSCVCPTCTRFCPTRPCAGVRIYGWPEVVWPPRKGPWPGPCPYGLSCPAPWLTTFDPKSFDRVVATFLATPDQRDLIEKTGDLRFAVEGGEAIGTVLEGGAGDFMQLVQSPKGKPAQVSVVSGESTLAEFRAKPETVGASTSTKLGYGLGGLLLGALLTLLGMRRRQIGVESGTMP